METFTEEAPEDLSRKDLELLLIEGKQKQEHDSQHIREFPEKAGGLQVFQQKLQAAVWI